MGWICFAFQLISISYVFRSAMPFWNWFIVFSIRSNSLRFFCQRCRFGIDLLCFSIHSNLLCFLLHVFLFFLNQRCRFGVNLLCSSSHSNLLCFWINDVVFWNNLLRFSIHSNSLRFWISDVVLELIYYAFQFIPIYCGFESAMSFWI